MFVTEVIAAKIAEGTTKDGRPFHFRTAGVKGIMDPRLLFLAVNKLVSAGNTAGKHLDLRVYSLAAFLGQCQKLFICRKFPDS